MNLCDQTSHSHHNLVSKLLDIYFADHVASGYQHPYAVNDVIGPQSI